jgi:hypothetical protein
VGAAVSAADVAGEAVASAAAAVADASAVASAAAVAAAVAAASADDVAVVAAVVVEVLVAWVEPPGEAVLVAGAELSVVVEAPAEVVVVASAVELDKELAGGVAVAAAVPAVPFEPAAAASVSFSFRCCVQAAEAVALVLTHHCTRQKTLRIDKATLLIASPSGVTSSANLVVHWACVASTGEQFSQSSSAVLDSPGHFAILRSVPDEENASLKVAAVQVAAG